MLLHNIKENNHNSGSMEVLTALKKSKLVSLEISSISIRVLLKAVRYSKVD